MDVIDDLLAIQRKNGRIWRKKIYNEYPGFCELGQAPNQNPNYWVFGMLVNEKNKTMLHFRNKGYYASSIHINNDIYSIFGNSRNLSGVAEFYNKFLALPSGWWVNFKTEVKR